MKKLLLLLPCFVVTACTNTEVKRGNTCPDLTGQYVEIDGTAKLKITRNGANELVVSTDPDTSFTVNGQAQKSGEYTVTASCSSGAVVATATKGSETVTETMAPTKEGLTITGKRELRFRKIQPPPPPGGGGSATGSGIGTGAGPEVTEATDVELQELPKELKLTNFPELSKGLPAHASAQCPQIEGKFRNPEQKESGLELEINLTSDLKVAGPAKDVLPVDGNLRLSAEEKSVIIMACSRGALYVFDQSKMGISKLKLTSPEAGKVHVEFLQPTRQPMDLERI